MLLTIAAGAAIALAIPQGTDTTFAVAANARLDLQNYAGEIVIETWTRGEVRIVADHSRRESITIGQQEGIVRVRPSSWQGGDADFEIAIEDGQVRWSTWSGARSPSLVEFTVTVPEGMPLDVGGPFTEVTITGPVGETTVVSNEGDLTISAVRGPLTVRGVEGDISISDVQGRMRVQAIDGEIWIENASGDVVAETTDGDIHLVGITSSNVEATSVDGDLQFGGPLAAQGLYTFATHDGDVTVRLPRDVGARVMVATYDGDVTSDFMLDMPEDFSGRRARFTLGDGGAQLEIEAFDGDIEILYLEN